MWLNHLMDDFSFIKILKKEKKLACQKIWKKD